MKPALSRLLIALALTFSLPVCADDTKHLDDTVAAGILFKLGYLFQSQGTWSGADTSNPESFQNAMASISKDLSNFSKTKRGVFLRKKGQNLISFLSKGVRLTTKPPNDSKTDIEAEKFLKSLGLDPKNGDPAKLAQIFTERIARYANISNTPTWVYDPTKRIQGNKGHSTQPSNAPLTNN